MSQRNDENVPIKRRVSEISKTPNPPQGNSTLRSSLASVTPAPHLGSETSRAYQSERILEDVNLLSSPLHFSERTPTRHGSNTPVNSRSFLRSDNRTRQVNVQSETSPDHNMNRSLNESRNFPDPTTSDANILRNKLVIWGTSIVIDECKKDTIEFLQNFTPYISLSIDDRNELSEKGFDLYSPLYLQKLHHISITEKPFMEIDFSHIKIMKPSLSEKVIIYPQEMIPIFDAVVNDLFKEMYSDVELKHQIQIQIFNIDQMKNMRDLDPDDIDKLISVNGLVIRCSGMIPEMHEAFFECSNCNAVFTVEIDCGRIIEPNVCTNCNSTRSIYIIHNRSLFTDKQVIKLQEAPDDMPPGQTPFTVLVFAHNDLVNLVQPGDRVRITGIYRAAPTRINPRQRTVRSVYRTYIDAIHFQKSDKNRLYSTEEFENGSLRSFSDERIQELKRLSEHPNIYNKLACAIAPNIYENIDIKKGILLQLFGGTIKDFKKAGRSRFRSEINILLCGDPGTSKSQLLRYVHALVPRGQYTSGKGSSAVGLTVYITKDPDTRQLVLQPGALVMSDNGICCIDEFDKMNDSTRSILHEVMEQQTLSIAKSGIICQLNARTSILAAANPVKSRWDTSMTTVENIKLPYTLLSRFDLIFLMLDSQSENFDTQLAHHLVSLYKSTSNTQVENDEHDQEIEMSLLKDYIAYARIHIHPKLSDDASQYLINSYTEMRKAGNVIGSITAYPRQLESLIRLSEAHAKMRFSNLVEIRDVDEAKRLHREALKQSCIDPKTGMIDVNILTTGVSLTNKKLQTDLAKAIKHHLSTLLKETNNKTFMTQTIFNELRMRIEKGFTWEEFEMAISLLCEEGFVSNLGKKLKIVE